MKIKKETVYILENEDGMKALAPLSGESIELELRDGTYHTGQVMEIVDNGITIVKSDGAHIYDANDVVDIKMCAPVQMLQNNQPPTTGYTQSATKEGSDIITTWYFPLEIRMLTDENREEAFDMDEYNFVDSREAVWYKDAILKQIEKDNGYFDTPRMLAEYIHDEGLSNKVYSMTPTVVEHDGRLWGAMVMQLSGTLTPEDINELKVYISGQNSDGYGEGLEQHGIRVPDGELYVSFWHSGNDYAIYSWEELDALAGHVLMMSSARRKPSCPIIGADGNVFNIMGIASRTLKENGMVEAANEMCSRVMESGSYANALAIIADYVEPVEAGGHSQSQSSLDMRM